MMLIHHSINSDWLFNTESRGPQANCFILEINETASPLKSEDSTKQIGTTS